MIKAKFKKNSDNLFVCEECNKICTSNKISLSHHIINFHKQSLKEYYDKWIKRENEDICKNCGKQTTILNTDKGYHQTCSSRCAHLYNYNKKCDANLKTYGIKHIFQLNDIKEKSKQTRFFKYGDENFNNQEKNKSTCMERYGVEHPRQDINIFNRIEKTTLAIKKFKDTNIYYQGSYELDFLNRYYSLYSNITRGPSIKYEYDGKNKLYFSDFYFSDFNLVIECKSNYFLTKHLDLIKAKELATINSGFNYLMILDKNYNEFNNLIKNYEHNNNIR
jgi:hypothetical protein